MELPRTLQLAPLLEHKSFFLFGPRATGKTTLIRRQLMPSAFSINLLNSQFYLRLAAEPFALEQLINESGKKLIVIDEVQRLPELLNEVHRLIEEKNIRFLLTGSSARKLRHGKANLLAGRVWETRLFPFTSRELPDFDLNRYLRHGGLPSVYLSEMPDEELFAYVDTYLREEIMAESLVRKLPPFSRFLKAIALSNGEMINFTKLANDCQVPPATVTEHVGILQDTLVGFMVPAWTESKKRKAIRTGKFYFFDTGVTHTLAGTRTLDRNSNLYGKSFEQFIAMEIRAWQHYVRDRRELAYWRSTHGKEVDFLIGSDVALEVKAATRVTGRDASGLRALAEENVFQKLLLVSQDTVETSDGTIRAIHWTTFLNELWGNRF